MTDKQWDSLRNELKRKYKSKPSTILVRSRMREVLGFTDRHQRAWTPIPNTTNEYYKESMVFLDFFDEKKYTMFLPKYGTFLNDNSHE